MAAAAILGKGQAHMLEMHKDIRSKLGM